MNPTLATYPPLVIDDHNFLDVTSDPLLANRLSDLIRTWNQSTQTRPAFLHLTETNQECDQAKLWSKRFQEQARHLILLGIGGSSLGANMLVNALAPNGLPVTFYDNICPEFLTTLYDQNWEDSLVLAVSKSGETAETLAQFLTVLPLLQAKLGSRVRQHVAIVTENPASALGRVASDLGIPIIPHHPVGGRFSVFSVTGLLPAAFAGADIDVLLAGAKSMAKQCLLDHHQENPAWRYAMVQAIMAKAGKNLSVIFAYGQRLEKISSWFRQLWAESLGKKDPSGQRVGLTPVDARGVTDQHSQLQLYLDGPNDKQFTLLYDPTLAAKGHLIPDQFNALPAVIPLVDHTVGELFASEFLGTRDALIHNNAPVRVLQLAGADPYALGQLILLLEMETVMMAACLGVTPFDQPAVEESKQRARVYLQGGEGGGRFF